MKDLSLKEKLSNVDCIENDAFEILKGIAEKLSLSEDFSEGVELLIRALEHRSSFSKYNLILNSLLSDAGLFPYVDGNNLISEKDQLALEIRRPLSETNKLDVFFHGVQAEVYWKLLDGENVVLSAPTSFGKSLITDGVIDTLKYGVIVLIVPTIALIDETRKRLNKFTDYYQIITHSSQPRANDKAIYILTQERAIERNDLTAIDLLIVDEFYKLSPKDINDSRSLILNHAFYKLLKISKQFYLLGPNIHQIPSEFERKFNTKLTYTDFSTVVSDVFRVDVSRGHEQALVSLLSDLKEPTIIYCRSPESAKNVADILISRLSLEFANRLRGLVKWIGDNFHDEWVLTRALSLGIGIHHGRIPRSIAQLQVDLFNLGFIKFLICTSTLIEGVNTAAKNVVIYDSYIAKQKFDYFTFKNIQGRSGRMFKHFIGQVFLFHEPPPENQLDLDFPAFTLSDNASDGLILQMEERDLNEAALSKLRKYIDNPILSFNTIKLNAHVDPNIQLQLAQYLHDNADELEGDLAWTGIPNSTQLYKICELIFKFGLVPKNSELIRSSEQLAFYTNFLRSVGDAGLFIKRRALANDNEGDVNQRIDNALNFLRNWASYHLPRGLIAIERIQNDVFFRLGKPLGIYSAFATKLENLMLASSAMAALEEYGIPIQVVKVLEPILNGEENLDLNIRKIKALPLEETKLTGFERMWLRRIIRYM